MRISFDLDDTLICHHPGACWEAAPPWYRRWLTSREPLRRGACSLMLNLIHRGWEIWIYTTSFRNPRTVRGWLRSYGIQVSGVINQTLHTRHFRLAGNPPPSKNPKAFGIELHVDDSEGVRIEGERLGFQVVVVNPEDAAWADKVLSAVHDIERGLRDVAEHQALPERRDTLARRT